ncbi:hypothetical protein P4571_08410 [Niallia alba]|uniref:hypothetical protein n=1 Tax=Niallia alba TaxID=2729105 RepID=UPI002E1CD4E4|nr:hypothetical protein [Niallia alba]
MEMKYVIEYEHLKDDLVTNSTSQWHFDKVKESANKCKLELTDEEFKGFFKLHKSDKNVNWLMHQMSVYNISFANALVSYITY